MLKILKKNFGDILNYILVILLFFLAIKKGGFYKTDIIFFSLALEFVGILSISYYYIKRKDNIKLDVIGILLLLLSFAYLLPIIFNNYTSLNDSLNEFIRYFNVYIIYKIVMLSDNKKIFKTILIYLGVFLGIIGIDGIANRFLEGILKYFSSGYLNIDLTRMSSTIQYANVLAIILLISSIFVFDELAKAIEEKRKNKIVLNYTLLFFELFCIVLTQSRIVIFIACIYFFVCLVKNRKLEQTYCFIFLALQVIIFSVLAFKYMYINTICIYYLTVFSLILSICISLILHFIDTNRDNKISKLLYGKYKLVFSLTFIIVILYLVLGFNISSPLVISEKSKDIAKRYVNNVEKGALNKLSFSVFPNTEDSRYRINIYKISSKNGKELLKTFEYYNNVSGNYELEFNADNDIKNIELEFDCYKGSITIDKAMINNKKVILNYVLLPIDIVYKLEDALSGSDSASSRFIYFKDALKIWNLSWKNRIIGIGGEGFKNAYQLVQNESYTSTEVHNSFIQILVESGALGFVIIVSIVMYYLLKYNNNVFKFAFLALVIHSIFDLDFSYMLILLSFAILLGINKKSENSNCIKIGIILEGIIFISIFVFSFILLVRINLAYYMKIPVYDKASVTFFQQAELVSKLEKRVILDSSENKYRKALASEYEKYLEMLNQNIKRDPKNIKLIEESKNIIQNIENNAYMMQENEKEEKDTLVNVSNIYFNNIYYLVQLNFENDQENGYIHYIDKIKSNLSFVEENYKYNTIAIELIQKSYTDYYYQLCENKIKSNSLEEFARYLKNEKLIIK